MRGLKRCDDMAGWRLILAPHKHDEARVETTHSHGAAKAACTDDE